MRDGDGIEGVQISASTDAKVVDGAAIAVSDSGVLASTVDDINLIRGIREDGTCHLDLGEHTLTGTGLAADESHRACETLAVTDDKVAAMLVLSIVVAAFIVKLLCGKWHEDSDLCGGEHAADFYMVVPEWQDGVQATALSEVVGVNLNGVLTSGRDDTHDLRIQLLLGICVGINEAREHIEMLVLVLEVIKNILSFLLGILEFLREDREIIALGYGAALLLDNLLVNPSTPGLNKVDGLGLVHGLHKPSDLKRNRQVNDVSQRSVGKLAAELLHHKNLSVDAVVQLDTIIKQPVRFEVNLARRDAVLRCLHASRGNVALIVEIERLVRIEQRMDD